MATKEEHAVARPMLNRYRFLNYGVALAAVAVAFAALSEGFFRLAPDPYLVEITRPEGAMSRKSGDLSANFTGRRSWLARDLQYRTNDGPWLAYRPGSPRASRPGFVVEVPNQALREGPNRLDIQVRSYFGGSREVSVAFAYDPREPALPAELDWRHAPIEAQDGRWERVEAETETRVRPVPGFEDYDRILLLGGTFAGGRRVEIEATFRNGSSSGEPFGFGVVPLWGGHNDVQSGSPRRGWTFAIAWYYSRAHGIGMEFSTKDGPGPDRTIKTYRDFAPQRDQTYRIVAEIWAERDTGGRHLGYRQRLRWQPASDGDADWQELSTAGRVAFPEREYAVALIAHRAQVEFGPVRISALPDRIVDE